MISHYDDLPDTTAYLRPLPERFGTGLGYGRCGCSPTDGDSCRDCRGDWIGDTDRKDRAEEIRRTWRCGELTARQFYLLSAAANPGGLPSPDAVAAVGRVEQNRAAA